MMVVIRLEGVFNQKWKNSRIFLMVFLIVFEYDSGNIIRKSLEHNKVEQMQSVQHKIPSFLLTLRQMLEVNILLSNSRMIIKKV